MEAATSIELLGVEILEPVTVVTDLLISAVCVYAYLKLRKQKDPLPSVRLFSYYFLAMAISTATGGIIGHGLQDILGFAWKIPTWIISMVSITLIELAAIFHAKPLLGKRTSKFFVMINIIELLAMIVVLLVTFKFAIVGIHATYGLLVIVFSFELYIYLKKRDEASKLILIAVGISALPAVVQLLKLSFGPWFNYNDIAHVLMAVASYVFYLGALKIKAIERGIS